MFRISLSCAFWHHVGHRFVRPGIRYRATCQDITGPQGDHLEYNAQHVLCFLRTGDPQQSGLLLAYDAFYDDKPSS